MGMKQLLDPSMFGRPISIRPLLDPETTTMVSIFAGRVIILRVQIAAISCESVSGASNDDLCITLPELCSCDGTGTIFGCNRMFLLIGITTLVQ